MRRIIKNSPMVFLEDWKKQFKSNNNRDAVYGDLKGEVKQRLKLSIQKEQFNLCCYCMKKLTFPDCHIEHIRPQCLYPTETLDYNNMLVSCNGSIPYREDHESCGHKRGNWHDDNYISPLEDGIESHFSYGIDGKIIGNDNRAAEMIDRLNLNCYSLIRKRKTAIYMAYDSDMDTDDIIKEYSIPNNEELPEYCAAVLYCLTHA